MVKRFKKEIGKKLIYESYDKLLEAWNVSKEEKDIDTSYGKTHIILAGQSENPPLLLFHGVGDNSAIMWIFNAEELSKHFYIIAVDTIGGPGKSIPNEKYFKGFERASWIDEILNELKINKTNIAGVSNGAYLAQYYSIKQPDRVGKIVCMAGTIASESSPNPFFRMMGVFLPEALFPNEKNIKKLMRKLCGSNADVFINNDEIMKHWLYLLKYFNNMSMGSHKFIRFSKNEIERIQNSSLFLIGDCDKISYHKASLRALDENKLNYKIFKSTGHGINHEESRAVNSEIIEFIKAKGDEHGTFGIL